MVGRIPRTISFDNEANIILDEVVAQGQDVSSFIRKLVKDYKGDNLDIATCEKRLQTIDIEIEKLKAESEFYQKRIEKLKIDFEEKIKKEEQRKKSEPTPEEIRIKQNREILEMILFRSKVNPLEAESLIISYINSKYAKYQSQIEKFLSEQGFIFDGSIVTRKVPQTIRAEVDA
jgi:hypothetical protein